MSTTDYDDLDGLGLAELVRSGEASPAELVECAIDRIERRNPRLNAVIHPMYERARAQAAAELPQGPFRGVPMLVKDLLTAIEGEPIASGSAFYRGHVAPVTSELARRYIATGAVVVGKTNTPEFGLLPTTEPVAFGPSRNPYDPSRTTGGSSGGSGAAVAARLVPLAGGGDGGGSIRIPSSCCGLFGLKPTRGRTPTGPLAAEGWDGFAIEHVLTRSVRDSAAMLDAVSGWFPGDHHFLPPPSSPFAGEVGAAPGRLRIAISTRPYLPSKVSPEVIAAVEDVARLCAELGHEVIDDAPALDGGAFGRDFVTVISGQTAALVREAEDQMGRKAGAEDLEVKTRLAAASGAAFSAGDYVYAKARLLDQARRVHQFMDRVDVLLNPTVALPPPPLGFVEKTGVQATAERIAARLPLGKLLTFGPLLDQIAAEAFEFVPWTPIYNVTGQPSMSVPLSMSAGGLPIGSMFTARFGDEATLFRLAAQLEAARPWAATRPPGLA